MGSSRRFGPLVYNSAAALAGAAAMFTLVRAAMVDLSKVEDREFARIFAPEPHQPANRLAFVQHGALSPSELASGQPQLGSNVAPQSGSTGPWSTEVRPDTAQSSWRLTMLPSLALPPEGAKPGTQHRTYSLKARLAEISAAANFRLAAKFAAATAAWPPSAIAFVSIQDEKILELHARPNGGAWKLIHRYSVLAASGGAGPKLRQGDRQVPEGVYGIAFLNPNSAYHISLRVNYPNAFDRQMAAKDGRKDLGGDIMIHGKNLSAGCLAMGDEAVEELFVLAAQTGLANVKLIIAPTDFRQNGLTALEPGQPEWLPKLYAEIAAAMSEFKAPHNAGLLSFFTKSN